jgi:hypothetical protein
VKEGDGDSIFLSREQRGEMDFVVAAIVVIDCSLEVGERVDAVFFFAPRLGQVGRFAKQFS